MKIFKLVVCEVIALLFTIMAVYALYINSFQALGLCCIMGFTFLVKSYDYS